MRGAETEYNEVPYPPAIYPQTHPDVLATMGALFGMKPAPVETCRVLELGCGDGMNVIAMAGAMPKAAFVGIDLATKPIDRGKEIVRSLGLQTVALHAADILKAQLNEERFDYIIAHGLYSWVPAAVRNRIMEICRDHLSDNGIAYISYNAYPGNHLREAARGMIQYHAQNFRDPAQQIGQARGLLKLVSRGRTTPELFHKVIGQELERCLKYTDAGFYHDDLSPMNEPFYFWEFAEHTKSFRLQYLAEAEFHSMQAEGMTPEVLSVLAQLDPANVIAREQYLDFFKGRGFRQTLLCREEAKLLRPVDSQRIANMLVSADVQPAGSNADGTEDFRGRHGTVIGTGNTLARAALTQLGAKWPERVPVLELSDGKPDGDLLSFLLRCYELDFVHLHTWSPEFTTEISERPVASALARRHATVSEVLPTPQHTTLKAEGTLGRSLVQLLDGTHDHAALLQKLAAIDPTVDADRLSKALHHLARGGLLIG